MKHNSFFRPGGWTADVPVGVPVELYGPGTMGGVLVFFLFDLDLFVIFC